MTATEPNGRRRPVLRTLDAIMTSAWAIPEANLRQIIEIAKRENGDSWKAIRASMDEPLDNTWGATVRDGVATIDIIGPIFPRANLMTEMSGATSLEMVAQDFLAAANNPEVAAIVLNIDSPGGACSGVGEFSSMVRDVAQSGEKKVIAYASNNCCSAAYWIASGANEIVAAECSIIGSIGVVATYDNSKEEGEIEFVSSQSPNKRPDLDTEDGKAQIQTYIDDMADVFIGNVAQNRGLTPEQVVSNFGAGGVKVGQKAVDAGMADRIGNYEGLIAELVSASNETEPSHRTRGLSDVTADANGLKADWAPTTGATPSRRPVFMRDGMPLISITAPFAPSSDLKKPTIGEDASKVERPEGFLAGHASIFNVVDAYFDVIEPGALTESLSQFDQRGFVCRNHEWQDPIGKPLLTREDEEGLYVEGQIVPTQRGLDTMIQVETGVIKDLSVMILTTEAHIMTDREGQQKFGREKWQAIQRSMPPWIAGVRCITKADLIEWGPTSLGVPGAHISEFKGFGSPAGLKTEEQFDTTLAAVENMRNRFEDIYGLKASEGRKMSIANVQRMATLRDALSDNAGQLDSLIETVSDADSSTEPESDQAEPASQDESAPDASDLGRIEFARFQAMRAEMNGVVFTPVTPA